MSSVQPAHARRPARTASQANASIPAQMNAKAARANAWPIMSIVNAIELVALIGLRWVAIRPTAWWPPSSTRLPVTQIAAPAAMMIAPALASARSRPSGDQPAVEDVQPPVLGDARADVRCLGDGDALDREGVPAGPRGERRGAQVGRPACRARPRSCGDWRHGLRSHPVLRSLPVTRPYGERARSASGPARPWFSGLAPMRRPWFNASI